MAENNIYKRFRNLNMSEEQENISNNIRNNLYSITDYINKTLPMSRETSLAITKIEEGLFWANASIARNGVISSEESNNE